MYWNTEEFSVLLGKVLTDVERISDNGDDELIFTTIDGEKYRMFHYQNCCEYVYIEDICGELSDLVGSPILMAEEVSNHEREPIDRDSSYTWTFYKLATVKGYVTIRWYGTSNGYYSESVDFTLMNKQHEEAK